MYLDSILIERNKGGEFGGGIYSSGLFNSSIYNMTVSDNLSIDAAGIYLARVNDTKI